MKNRTEELKLLSDCQLTKFEVLKELEYLREYHEIRATGGDSEHGRGEAGEKRVKTNFGGKKMEDLIRRSKWNTI